MNDYTLIFLAGVLCGVGLSILVVGWVRDGRFVLRHLWRYVRSR